jgi:murein L,D-transpeptidase YafK
MSLSRILLVLLAGSLLGSGTVESVAHAQRADASERTEALSIVVMKAERKLHLYAGGKLVKSYPIALGTHPTGKKRNEGDGATPEGDYYVTHTNAKSRFHLSLGISYPNVSDATEGLRRSVISPAEYQAIVEAIQKRETPPQHTRLGGEVFVHGGGLEGDWTRGCVALENKDIEELFDKVPVRTPVHIVP